MSDKDCLDLFEDIIKPNEYENHQRYFVKPRKSLEVPMEIAVSLRIRFTVPTIACNWNSQSAEKARRKFKRQLARKKLIARLRQSEG